MPVMRAADDEMYVVREMDMKSVIIWVWEIPNLPRNKGDGF
jgi:hypothetical protein